VRVENTCGEPRRAVESDEANVTENQLCDRGVSAKSSRRKLGENEGPDIKFFELRLPRCAALQARQNHFTSIYQTSEQANWSQSNAAV
jgi:hypothetical protein